MYSLIIDMKYFKVVFLFLELLFLAFHLVYYILK